MEGVSKECVERLVESKLVESARKLAFAIGRDLPITVTVEYDDADHVRMSYPDTKDYRDAVFTAIHYVEEADAEIDGLNDQVMERARTIYPFHEDLERKLGLCASVGKLVGYCPNAYLQVTIGHDGISAGSLYW